MDVFSFVKYSHSKTLDHLLNKDFKIIEINTDDEESILSYLKFILKKLNINCKIIFDKSKPDGTPRKIIDSSVARNYGWYPKIALNEGFDLILKDYFSVLKKSMTVN